MLKKNCEINALVKSTARSLRSAKDATLELYSKALDITVPDWRTCDKTSDEFWDKVDKNDTELREMLIEEGIQKDVANAYLRGCCKDAIFQAGFNFAHLSLARLRKMAKVLPSLDGKPEEKYRAALAKTRQPKSDVIPPTWFRFRPPEQGEGKDAYAAAHQKEFAEYIVQQFGGGPSISDPT